MKIKKIKNAYKNEIVRKINVSRKTYEGEVFGIMGSRLGFLNCSELNKVFTVSPEQMDFIFPNDIVIINVS